jgi:hypothetical protein
MLIRYAAANISPPDLLIERIGAEAECRPYLIRIIRGGESPALSVIAAEILTAREDADGDGELSELLTDLIFDGACGGELTELAAEKLRECAPAAAPLILRRLSGADLSLKRERAAADILSRSELRDERIFEFLLSAFKRADAEGYDIAPYAAYLSNYGDTRALPVLIAYGRRRDIDYIQFMETRAAVEALGGVLPGEEDFIEDEYYRLLKEEDGN